MPNSTLRERLRPVRKFVRGRPVESMLLGPAICLVPCVVIVIVFHLGTDASIIAEFSSLIIGLLVAVALCREPRSRPQNRPQNRPQPDRPVAIAPHLADLDRELDELFYRRHRWWAVVDALSPIRRALRAVGRGLMRQVERFGMLYYLSLGAPYDPANETRDDPPEDEPEQDPDA